MDQLGDVGGKFRFAIIADPQVSGENHRGEVGYNAMLATEQTAKEINSMEPRLAFTVHLGDFVNVFNPESEANYRRLAGLFETPNILVHGNHDTKPPFTPYLKMQKELTGIGEPFYSFDAGAWHFIVTPCNLPGGTVEEIHMEQAMLAWLEKDLAANKNRPTVFFNHLHFMPQGLSQTEFYLFPLSLRKKLLDLLTRHGNVKYYFNGHVHNGIQTAEKTAWKYRGIKFFSVPTIIQPRPYGEEFPAFGKGVQRGGYYLVVDVDGGELILRGRLVGVKEDHVFKDCFKPFRNEEFPRWFRTVGELPAKPALENGSFKNGLKGWNLPERYAHGTDPFFVAEAGRFAGKNAARLMIKSPVKSLWCVDEYHEVYQTLHVEPDRPLSIAGSYFIPEEVPAGGGYFIATLMGGGELKGLMMFRWSQREADANYLPRCYGYAINGRQKSWLFFQNLGLKKQGMFWNLPQETGKWHSFSADLSALHDQAHGAGAFKKLGVDKVLLSAGIWNYTFLENSKTETYITNLALKNVAAESRINGKPITVDETNFTCLHGQTLANTERGQSLERYPIRKEGNLLPSNDWKRGQCKSMATVEQGAWVIRDDSRETKENGWWQSERFGVEPGWKLNATWKWRFEDAKKTHITFRYFDADGNYIRQDARDAKGTSKGWKEEFQALETPPRTRLMDVVVNSFGDGTGTVWLKDVNVTCEA